MFAQLLTGEDIAVEKGAHSSVTEGCFESQLSRPAPLQRSAG